MREPTHGKIGPGTLVAERTLHTITGGQVTIPDGEHLVHLHFRRFAGCPVCNVHMRALNKRHEEIRAAGIVEVVVFHSSAEDLLVHAEHLPFPVIADPDKRLYVEFKVESAPRALLDPRAWPAILRGIFYDLWRILRRQQKSPGFNPEGGSLGLPADFLIAGDGRVVACKYGDHVYDQWSVDELLETARSNRRPSSPRKNQC